MCPSSHLVQIGYAILFHYRTQYILARAACVRCHGTKCPLLMALFLFLSSFRRVTFLPEGVIVGFKNSGGPPLPPGGRFYRFLLEKTRKVLRIASNGEKIDRTLALKNFRDGGLRGWSSVRRAGSEGPHWQ
jgi:hypothetical protein